MRRTCAARSLARRDGGGALPVVAIAPCFVPRLPAGERGGAQDLRGSENLSPRRSAGRRTTCPPAGITCNSMMFALRKAAWATTAAAAAAAATSRSVAALVPWACELGELGGSRALHIDADNRDNVRRRLLHRSQQRGWLELDLVMGEWASKHLDGMGDGMLRE